MPNPRYDYSLKMKWPTGGEEPTGLTTVEIRDGNLPEDNSRGNPSNPSFRGH